jgi:hypothetical protein
VGGDVDPREGLAALQAAHAIHRSMDVDHASGSGAQVESVDVLRDDAVDDPGYLQVGERPVPVIGLGRREVPPAEMAAGPVALSRSLVVEEGLEGHRGTHRGALAPVVGDARVGADPGAGERDDAAP